MTSDNDNPTDNATMIADIVEGGETPFETPHPSGGEQGDTDVNFDDEINPDDVFVDGVVLDDEESLGAKRESISAGVIAMCAVEPPNDAGNGNRLLAHFRDELLNVRSVGWHTFTGTHWQIEGGAEAVVRYAQQAAARIVLEADFLTATPSERRAIDLAADAEIALKPLKKIHKPSAVQKKEIYRLERVVDQGKWATGELKKRQLNRRKYAISSGNGNKKGGKIGNMIDNALAHATVKADALDADPYAFNVENGTLHFVKVDDPDGTEARGFKKWVVELRPHDRRELITKVSPVIYDDAATCEKFLASITRFQPVEPVRDFVQRYFGYSLTGSTGEQCLVFNFGDGSNWKSTFVEIISRVMGNYATSINFASLTGGEQKSGSQASPDIARLPGARMVRASEAPRGVGFDEALVKSLTGGEPMLARANYGDFFEFKPDFKLVLSGNNKPTIGGTDHGIWRRICLVPWPVKIDKKDARLMDDVLAELWQERAGILNWLIEGALEYLNNGLRVPQEVLDATEEYREEQDPVGPFVADCVTTCEPSAKESTTAREVYQAFISWCWANAVDVKWWGEQRFSKAMASKGFEKKKMNDARRYLNVKLHDVPKTNRNRSPEPVHPSDNTDEVPG